jgi:hypothetical protein
VRRRLTARPACDAERQSDDQQAAALAKHERAQLARLRTQRGPHAQFLHPLRHPVGNHSEQTEAGEDRGECRERRRQHHRQPRPRDLAREHLLDRADLERGHVGIDRLEGRSDRRDERFRRHVAPDDEEHRAQVELAIGHVGFVAVIVLRSAMSDAAHDADHAPPHVAHRPDHPADRVLSRPEPLGEQVIDDRDQFRLRALALTEAAAGEGRNADRREIARRCRELVRARPPSVLFTSSSDLTTVQSGRFEK